MDSKKFIYDYDQANSLPKEDQYSFQAGRFAEDQLLIIPYD